MSIPHAPSPPLPSTARLVKATVAAFVVAAVLLVTTVLPAEYGIDPTGIGTRLGLNVLVDPAAQAGLADRTPPRSATPAAAGSPAVATPATPAKPDPVDAAVAGDAKGAAAVIQRGAAYRQETFSLTLAPGSGAEVKARMQAGDAFVFHWQAEAALSVDMHGERVDAAKDEYTSYWIEPSQQQASGTFTAPFDGSHGWYWLNRSQVPVTVKVDVSGFQQALYRP